MRKRIFFAAFLSMIVAEMGAVAATARDSARVVNNKSDSSTTQQSGNTVARSATRAVSSRATTTAPAATQQNVVNTPATVSAPATNTPGVVARAGSVQKALNTGTKVATATENTSVPKECQDAFFGCMDAFCILDNASGGRCQCSDRITELDQVLEDILKLDEQTYIMATEGVERIQMGEAEEQIIARAKAAGDKVVAGDDVKKSRTLDLSAWNNSVFSVDDDIFDSLGSSDSVSSFADKKGDSLYVASAKMCAEQVSPSCKTYTSMLQLVYSQRIKSDCVAYENSLRAQKTQSQQKLQTAQKALRDAALTEYQNQNKYATVGECAIAFSQCMQTTAECGADYTGCVTLAAKENVKNNKSGTKAKQTKIKGAVSGADITLAASTLDQLLAKKTICESVTKQCVNANKNDAVWTAFLRNAAPALKSAELIAEQNLRSSCIPTIAECFKNSCKAQFGEDDANYDMCLSNPEVYKSLCKVQLEPCLEATGGTYDNPTDSSLWVGLKSMLAAMKVDACTAEVKSCLTERCGDDYSGCIGLDTESIGRLCPYQKLTACMSEKKDPDTVAEYVAQIAQGLALQIDNALATACQNAVNEAMIRVCGDTESCEKVVSDDGVGTRSLKYEICKTSSYNRLSRILTIEDQTCKSSVDALTKSDLNNSWSSKLSGIIYWNLVDYDVANKKFIPIEEYISNLEESLGQNLTAKERQVVAERVYGLEIDLLESVINNTINTIESDPKVQYCMTGRQVQGFNASATFGSATGRFPNLTDQMRQVVAYEAIQKARDNYLKEYDNNIQNMMSDAVILAQKMDNKLDVDTAKQYCADWAGNSILPIIKKPLDGWQLVGAALIPIVGPISVLADLIEGAKAQNNQSVSIEDGHVVVDEWNYKATINTRFNESTGVCTKETVAKKCKKGKNKCRKWYDEEKTIETMDLL